MSVTQIKINSLPAGTVAVDSVVLFNSSDSKTTYQGTAGALAALSGPVASVNGLTGAVSLAATSVGAAPASHNHSTGDINNFSTAVVAIAATAAPVTAVNGLTGAVTLGATAVGAAPASHTHATGDITGFATAVALIAGTASPVTSVNGLTGAVTISGGGGDVSSVNGLTGAVSLSAASVGAAPTSHAHVTGDITNFGAAVALIAGTTGPVASVNGVSGAVSLSSASVGAAGATHASQHMRGGTDPYLLVLGTVAALTQDENNLALGSSDVVRISAATTNRDITGFTGGSTGVAVLLINTGATYTLTVKHAHTGSTEANRVLARGATDYAVTANGHAVLLVYDPAESRWRAV